MARRNARGRTTPVQFTPDPSNAAFNPRRGGNQRNARAATAARGGGGGRGGAGGRNRRAAAPANAGRGNSPIPG